MDTPSRQGKDYYKAYGIDAQDIVTMTEYITSIYGAQYNVTFGICLGLTLNGDKKGIAATCMNPPSYVTMIAVLPRR